MDKRPGIIAIALFSIAVAACSVEAAPRAPQPMQPRRHPQAQAARGRATPPPADPYFYGRPGGVQRDTPSRRPLLLRAARRRPGDTADARSE